MVVQCKNFHALRFMAERKVGSLEANPIFSNCFQGETISVQHIPLLQDPLSLLRDLLTASTAREKGFRKNIVIYKTAVCMASVHVTWVSRGEGQSGFNPTVTPQGRIHHFLGALQLARSKRPASQTLMYSVSSVVRIAQVLIALSRPVSRACSTSTTCMFRAS